MPKHLTQGQMTSMTEDGFIAPIAVFPATRAAGYRAALEAYEASVRDRPAEEVLFTLSRFKPHLLFTWLDEICHVPVLLDAIDDVIGPVLHGIRTLPTLIFAAVGMSALGWRLRIVIPAMAVCG